MPPEDLARFHRRVLELLQGSGIPFLVGGAYALAHHTGIHRQTLDLDLFVLPEDARRTLDHFDRQGYRTELTFPHWLGKIYRRRRYADIIFSSGNGVARVDRGWFERAVPGQVLGRAVSLCPIEEMVWSKSFVMERERFDGADVLHLLRAAGPHFDWRRLVERFESHRRVLISHLLLFGYVYPAERDRIPGAVLQELIAALDRPDVPPYDPPICRGPLLSRTQYLPDLRAGLADARVVEGIMSDRDIETWTQAGGVPAPKRAAARRASS